MQIDGRLGDRYPAEWAKEAEIGLGTLSLATVGQTSRRTFELHANPTNLARDATASDVRGMEVTKDDDEIRATAKTLGDLSIGA